MKKTKELKGKLIGIGKKVYTTKYDVPYMWGEIIINDVIYSIMIPMANYYFAMICIMAGSDITVRELPKNKGYEQSYVMDIVSDFQNNMAMLEILVEQKVNAVLATKGI